MSTPIISRVVHPWIVWELTNVCNILGPSVVEYTNQGILTLTPFVVTAMNDIMYDYYVPTRLPIIFAYVLNTLRVC